MLKFAGGGTATVMGSAATGVSAGDGGASDGQEQSSNELPPPRKVLRDARAEGERTTSADLSEPGVNVAVPELPDDPDVRRTDEGYAGGDAGDLGRLAAVVAVADDVRLHFPSPDTDAAGPWLALEPLSGQIATVQSGTGRVRVTADYREPDGGHGAEFADCLTEVRAASDLSHPNYPVDRAVFTTGMMEYTLADIETGEDSLTATFDVSTIPTTSEEGVRARFESLDCVREVSYEARTEVERAAPSDALRDAVERAHRSVLGAATYEWSPAPTVFGSLPDDKVAFGLGGIGASEFTNADYEACVGVLSETLGNLGDGR